jgi:hypothetical protein
MDAYVLKGARGAAGLLLWILATLGALAGATEGIRFAVGAFGVWPVALLGAFLVGVVFTHGVDVALEARRSDPGRSP